MLPRSPIDHPVRVTHLKEIVQREEFALAQLQRAVHELDAQGKDSAAARRRLQSARPIMDALRMMRLQIIAAGWRAGPRLGAR